MIYYTQFILGSQGLHLQGYTLMNRLDYLLSLDKFILTGALVISCLFLLMVIGILFGTIKVLTKLVLRSGGLKDSEINSQMNFGTSGTGRNFWIWGGIVSVGLLIFVLFLYHPFDSDEQKDGNSSNVSTVSANSSVTSPAASSGVTASTDSTAKKAGGTVNATLAKFDNNPKVLASGRMIYLQYCLACHGDKGQGLVGPNLTDEYWLHGNKVADLIKTIKVGELSKGMPSWDKTIASDKISDVANYIKSLGGTKPENPKPPQGDKLAD